MLPPPSPLDDCDETRSDASLGWSPILLKGGHLHRHHRHPGAGLDASQRGAEMGRAGRVIAFVLLDVGSLLAL
jgi:hypothetical protein